MTSRWLVLLAAVLSGCAHAGKRHKSNPDKHDAPGFVVLNAERTAIKWSDGDSFKIEEGPFKGRGTRLQGYNTLEAFGPVHRWGEWTPRELFDLAKASSHVAASQEWTCTTDGKEDGYHRVLILCPDLAVEMVRQGQAMAYAPEGGKVDPKALEAQREAQKEGRGMWKKGVVKGIVTSVHSLGEDAHSAKESYNRVVDTRTGEALRRPHTSKYETCQEVCETTDGDVSCMVYVPFEIRYRKKPECLK